MMNQNYTTRAEAEVSQRPHSSALDRLAAKIEEIVRCNPDVRLDHGQDFIRVMPLSPTGLPVTVVLSEGRCSVSLASWHDDFESEEVALSFVELAISGDLRVKVETIGGKASSSTVERIMPDGTWAVESSVSAVRFFNWGRKAVHYLRNDWVPSPDIFEYQTPPMFAPTHVFGALQRSKTPEQRLPL